MLSPLEGRGQQALGGVAEAQGGHALKEENLTGKRRGRAPRQGAAQAKAGKCGEEEARNRRHTLTAEVAALCGWDGSVCHPCLAGAKLDLSVSGLSRFLQGVPVIPHPGTFQLLAPRPCARPGRGTQTQRGGVWLALLPFCSQHLVTAYLHQLRVWSGRLGRE